MSALLRKPGFWILVQWIPWIVLTFAVWPLPTWRYLLALVATIGYAWTEQRYWRARRREQIDGEAQ
jgi:hypothetical protein